MCEDKEMPKNLLPKPAAIDAERVADLLGRIRERQQQFQEAEAGGAAHLVEIGALLAALQTAASRNWEKTVKEVGYHPREACRLQLIGASWWSEEIRTHGSDFLVGLPLDSKKLEWLCRLSREQLGELRQKHPGLWSYSRPKMTALVQEMRGDAVKTRSAKPKSLSESIEKHFESMQSEISRALAKGGATDSVEALSTAIDIGVEKVRRALKPQADTPEAVSQQGAPSPPAP
jgi:hypothetical protein